jgi:hypothetical protein
MFQFGAHQHQCDRRLVLIVAFAINIAIPRPPFRFPKRARSLPMMRLWFIIALSFCLFSDAAAADPGAAPATQPALPSLSHSSISIPWEDLRGLLEKNNPAAERPPIDFAFSPATYTATVSDKGVAVSANVEVSLLVDGWTLVPLGPANSGVTSAAVDGQPASLVVRGEQHFVLLQGKGQKKITLNLSRDISTEAGHRAFDLPLIPSALVTVSVRIPQKNLAVHSVGATGVTVAENGAGTVVQGTFHGGVPASFSWQPAPPPGAAADARTYVDGETLVTVEKGLLRAGTHLKISIERAPIKELKIDIDPRLTVLSVSGQDIAQWKQSPPAQPGNAGSLTVTFNAETQGERAIDIIAERDIAEAGGEVSLRPPAVVGAKRDRGYVAIATAGAFEIRPGKSEADRVSVSELPAALRSPGGGNAPLLQIGYRYLEPAEVTLLLEKVKVQPAQILATTLTRVDVERGNLRCRADINYEIIHAGIDTLRVGLPDGIEVTSVNGVGIRDTQTVTDNKQRTLVVGLKDLAQGNYALAIEYVARFDEAKDAAPAVPLLTNPGAVQDRGFIGIEVRDSVEIAPTPTAVQRIDVKELPESLWTKARSPLLFGYRYDAPGAKLSLALTRNADLDVLVAMSDICEVATTYTPDGKSITKMMLVTRNNLKQYMTLKMPEGAQVWSAFVDDHPVTPARNAKGDVLIPLKKSDAEDADDDDSEEGKSYRARRERRRAEEVGQARVKRARVDKKMESADDAPPDLKPYDVEIVFVTPAMKLADHGQVKPALPQSDIPIGHLSWAIFLPANLRVVDAEGNVAEVSKFTLPFPHFGDVAYEHGKQLDRAQDLQQAQQSAEAMKDAAQTQLAERAKAQGVLPVRIEIPIIGEIHRFEKFLTVDEAPAVALTYSRRE